MGAPHFAGGQLPEGLEGEPQHLPGPVSGARVLPLSWSPVSERREAGESAECQEEGELPSPATGLQGLWDSGHGVLNAGGWLPSRCPSVPQGVT